MPHSVFPVSKKSNASCSDSSLQLTRVSCALPVQPVAMLTTEGPSAELDSGPALLPAASCRLGSRFSLVGWNVN